LERKDYIEFVLFKRYLETHEAAKAVVRLLPDIDSVHLKELPRMADFAKWSTAAEEPLGFMPGAFEWRPTLGISNRPMRLWCEVLRWPHTFTNFWIGGVGSAG
jgi:hypothetical protein